jgi:quercetin dioxygenase-like cupin family protein
VTTYTFAPPRPAPIDHDLLDDIADGIATAEPLWRAHVVHDEHERRPVRLLATPAYEVWVIGWTPGQGLPVHDHGDALGTVVVVEGELTERSATGGSLAARRLHPGDTLRLPVGHIHDVHNDGASPATSIHVYSPPLASMTTYDASLTPTAIEDVEDEPPVLAVDAVTLLAHPSVRG